ncbi:DUF599 domain-containing protein [Yoonia sp.]|jgi:uncharacterized membrane protein|uniref:DUF599 domain-containing protein n=1 Tax=Yoonia sp. TaxID=2212373 RepID=UPI0023A13C27|nr:DUF599 domain-containing protein [Yoonia sp.]MDE0851246.1 DUF599 domain-containing protein [Yoonia sp.]
MQMIEHLALLTYWDAVAAAFLICAYFLLGWMIEHPPKSRPSVTKIMSENRREWLRVFVTRDPRIFDSQIMGSLRQGTAFFASTCIFAIGGVFALIANTDPLRGVAAEISTEDIPIVVWQVKLGLVALMLSNGFLKFVWANRIFGYCSVMMAAVPNDPDHPEALPRALQAAELNIRAAINFNRGLRSMYFALGGLAWLIGSAPFLGATAAVIWLIWSREFASLPRDILLGKYP